MYKGNKKEYNKTYNTVEPVKKVIMARSEADAKAKFKEDVNTEYEDGHDTMVHDSDKWKRSQVGDIFIDDVSDHDSYEPTSDSKMTMKSS